MQRVHDMVNEMRSRSAVTVRRLIPHAVASRAWDENDLNDLEAAFVYADAAGRHGRELGHVDLRGDVYEGGGTRVGHVAAAMDDVGEIYRGEDHWVGHVRISPDGDGYVYSDSPDDDLPHHAFLRGVVTQRGDIYAGDHARNVGVITPLLDVERMGAAALLLGLLSPASDHGT
jgi:hypothetical protein